MNNGIDTNTRNFSVLRNEFVIKLFSDLIDVSILFSEIDEYFAGFVIPPNTWLVNPSILLASIRIVAIGSRIRINNKINSENFRWTFFSLRNFMKKNMDIGTKNNNDSYLTIDDNARKINEKTYNFEFFDNEKYKKKVVRKIKIDSVKPSIEFSISLWLNPNRHAPIIA